MSGDVPTAQAIARHLAPLASYPCGRLTGISYARLPGGAVALVGERAQAKLY
jgi:hypothetical protein